MLSLTKECTQKAIMIPIFKNENKNNTDNYRGISLLSLISKCYTSVLNKRLVSWAEENDLLVSSLVLWAQSTTKDYIRARKKMTSCQMHKPAILAPRMHKPVAKNWVALVISQSAHVDETYPQPKGQTVWGYQNLQGSERSLAIMKLCALGLHVQYANR